MISSSLRAVGEAIHHETVPAMRKGLREVRSRHGLSLRFAPLNDGRKITSSLRALAGQKAATMKKERLFVSGAHEAITKLLAQEDRALEQRIDPLVWAF